MSLKSKGSNAERELLHMFWAKNWACIRSAGSGSMKYPGPDLLVGNLAKRMAIECKTTKGGKIYLNEHDVGQLKDFSRIFDSRPWFAVKFAKKEWRFLGLEDLKKTKTGYVIDSAQIDMYGISFEELINY